jgi:hypothetical protein
MPNLTVLHIWVKGRLTDFNLMCMKRAKEIYPDADFVFFSDRLAPFPWMNRVTANYLNINSPQMYSDYARLFYLSNQPHTLYIDCDVYCLKPIPLDDFGSAGIWAIYNHDKMDAIKSILKNRNGQNMNAWYGKDLALTGGDLSKYFIHREKEVINYLKRKDTSWTQHLKK